MDQHSETKLIEVMPRLADLTRQMFEILENENITIEVTQGLRTWAEQDALYAEGRTMPGKEVTNAKGGESWHNYGCAVDVAPFDNGIPDWNSSHPAWARIVEVGESLGLASGISYKDEPHFELTGQYPADPPQEAKDIYAQSGVQGVWDSIVQS
jgi:peptidoglycan L-alanyl-D-glutamate endopeptidase CwlK